MAEQARRAGDMGMGRVATMRILATLTLLESGAGIVATVVPWFWSMSARGREIAWARLPPGTLPWASAMAAASLALEAAQATAGVLLWRLKRAGLSLLVWSFGVEAFYLVAFSLVAVKPGHLAAAAATVLGNSGLLLEGLTAYPLLAAVLVALAYRRLGGPPRRVDRTTGDEKGAAPGPADAGPVVLARGIAVIAALEAVVGAQIDLQALSKLRSPTPFSPPVMHAFHGQLSALLPLACVAITATLLFNLLLVASSVLVWRLRERGLALMVCTLAAEVVYYAVTVHLPSAAQPASGGGVQSVSLTALRIGRAGLFPQYLTGFPLVLAPLIALARRRLRAREPEQGAAIRNPRGAPPAPRRAATVMEILALAAFLEGAVGVVFAARAVAGFRQLTAFPAAINQIFHLRPAPLTPVFYATTGVAVLFDLGLIGCAILLWKARRVGLAALTWLLAIEIAYVVVGAAVTANRAVAAGLGKPGRAGLALAVVVSSGSSGLAPQLFTVFPLVAGALLFFAYRYLGTPAREAG